MSATWLRLTCSWLVKLILVYRAGMTCFSLRSRGTHVFRGGADGHQLHPAWGLDGVVRVVRLLSELWPGAEDAAKVMISSSSSSSRSLSLSSQAVREPDTSAWGQRVCRQGRGRTGKLGSVRLYCTVLYFTVLYLLYLLLNFQYCDDLPHCEHHSAGTLWVSGEQGGQWSQWSDWTRCSARCGAGYRQGEYFALHLHSTV